MSWFGRKGVTVAVAPTGETYACADGQSLLMAGLAAGLGLPYECASGACGSCRCTLVSGAVESRWPEAPGLSARDRRRGDVILMCQSVPRTDCTIKTRPRPPALTPRPRTVKARVAARTPLTGDMSHITLGLAAPLPFRPGQFVILDVEGRGRRAYSMADPGDDPRRPTFIVKEKPGGAVSGWLHRTAPIGARCRVEGPYGHAYLRDDTARPVVAIAGGSGLAPIWSLAQAAARRGGRDLHVYFGVNTPSDVCFQAEFEALAGNPRARVDTIVARPEGASFRAGLVGEAVLEDFPSLKDCDVYMAGPPGMIDALLRQFMTEDRVDADHLYFDRFS